MNKYAVFKKENCLTCFNNLSQIGMWIEKSKAIEHYNYCCKSYPDKNFIVLKKIDDIENE